MGLYIGRYMYLTAQVAPTSMQMACNPAPASSQLPSLVFPLEPPAPPHPPSLPTTPSPSPPYLSHGAPGSAGSTSAMPPCILAAFTVVAALYSTYSDTMLAATVLEGSTLPSGG